MHTVYSSPTYIGLKAGTSRHNFSFKKRMKELNNLSTINNSTTATTTTTTEEIKNSMKYIYVALFVKLSLSLVALVVQVVGIYALSRSVELFIIYSYFNCNFLEIKKCARVCEF